MEKTIYRLEAKVNKEYVTTEWGDTKPYYVIELSNGLTLLDRSPFELRLGDKVTIVIGRK